MSHSLANETPSTTPTYYTEQIIQPEVSMVEPQGANESRRYNNSTFLYSDATYNVRDFISHEDNEYLDKSYGDDSPNEICAFKLDQGKIDELANDYRAETCVSSNRESAIQKESYKETVKSDGTSSRNEDEFRCKSNRKRKTRRKMPKGVIIELSNDVYGTSRNGIRISVISMHNLASETKFVAVPKIHPQYSMCNPSPRKKVMNKMIDNSILAVFCTENCSKMKKTQRSVKRKHKNYPKESTNNILHRDIKTTVNAPKKLENTLNERRELHVENDTQSLCTPNKILDSTQYCHHDNTLVDIDNAQYPILNTRQTYVDARKRIANCCCSIFNDKHQEYHICDRDDYNADGSDFNAEMQADWTAECFHPEYTHAKGCRCFYDSSECDPDINMQCDRWPLISTRLFKNSALPKKHQREERLERLRSDELRTDVAPEFATEADEYSSDGVERCTNCDGEKGSLASTIRKRAASKASVLAEPGGSVADLRDSRRPTDTSRCEIGTRPGKRGWRTTTTTMVEGDDDQSYKSDSLKAADTWDARARRDNCIGRRHAGRVVAEPSRSDQAPGEKGGFARGMDSKWKRSSIETDAQQLDYKWKRRIATVDTGICASVDFKRKRDSRSQTRSDNTNTDGKRRETRDYSLWTSLQMGKIWSQLHDACKNVVKLAATSVSRVVKDAPKSERSQRNPVEVADATLVESSPSCAGKICGETCRKNLMLSKSGKKVVARQEPAIGDVGKRHGGTETPMRKNSRAIAPSRRDTEKHVCQNAEKEEDEKCCVTYSEYERDGYRDVVEFSSRKETYSRDEDVHSQSRLSESFTYLENSTYPGFRSRGGSDDNRDSARSIGDKQKSVQRIPEEARSIRRYRNSISKKCICYDKTQEARCTDRSSQHAAVCYELSVTTDHQAIRAGVPDVSRNKPLHHEPRLTNVSSLEDNRRMGTHTTSEQTRSREEAETCENIEDAAGAETERNFTSAIADATVSSTEADPTVHSSRNDPDEPIASTSKWETSPASPGKSRRNRPGSRSPFCATAMKFWRRRTSVDNKTIAPMLKRSRRSIERKELSTTYDSRVKITQIEPSTVQTAQEGNKRRAYVNVQMQTPGAIVTRILSEFLVSGEKERRVLMSIMLQSESDHDVSDKREAETQTSSNDVTSIGINVFGYPDRCPAITTASKMVQCFVCDKQDCYEITRQSDSSIDLEEALIEEYPETFESDDYLAKRRTDITIPP